MNLVDKIYELTYLPMLTPYNLLDNMKLDNYTEINFKKNNLGVVSEITCIIDNRPKVFYYQFDNKNCLLEIYYYEKNTICHLFDRNQLLENFKSEFVKVNIAK